MPRRHFGPLSQRNLVQIGYTQADIEYEMQSGAPTDLGQTGAAYYSADHLPTVLVSDLSYTQCKANGIFLYVAPRSRLERHPGLEHDEVAVFGALEKGLMCHIMHDQARANSLKTELDLPVDIRIDLPPYLRKLIAPPTHVFEYWFPHRASSRRVQRRNHQLIQDQKGKLMSLVINAIQEHARIQNSR